MCSKETIKDDENPILDPYKFSIGVVRFGLPVLGTRASENLEPEIQADSPFSGTCNDLL